MVALAADHSAKEIATLLGCAEQTVWDVLAPRGVRPVSKTAMGWRRLDPETVARILALAEALPVSAIVAQTGRSRTTIRRVLAAHSVQPHTPARRGRRKRRTSPPRPTISAAPTPEHPAPLGAIRRFRRLSLPALAGRTGLTTTRLGEWELAGDRVRRRRLHAVLAHGAALAAALGVDPLAIAECRRILLPEAEDLWPPEPGRSDRRAARLPFVRWLRGIMLSRGWGTGELAVAAGVTRTSAERWVFGRALPGPAQQRRLAEAVGGPGVAATVARLAGDAQSAYARDEA